MPLGDVMKYAILDEELIREIRKCIESYERDVAGVHGKEDRYFFSIGDAVMRSEWGISESIGD